MKLRFVTHLPPKLRFAILVLYAEPLPGRCALTLHHLECCRPSPHGG